ncbi:hypothetical protein [Vibrio owensii]|uniref:hypothetical protein n=1 Tax=Vibrio owensii TaxID=696485 RepID=UPI0018F1BC46|nr:hypothetical protein [Vibrio owensii]CAH1554743.1 conserved exported hypothetical protein [Vibrio owensii]
MKTKMLSIALMLASPLVSAKWLNTDNTDEISERRTLSAFSYKYQQEESIGVRCDISNGKKETLLTFDVDSALGVPNTEVDMFVKVDDNKPIKFRGRLYSNSYRSGFVRMNDKTGVQISKLLAQMIAGNRAFVKIQNDRRSEIVDYSVSLSGFTSSSNKTLSACDLNPKAVEMKAADKDRLSEINEAIKKLNSEKEAILSKY